MSGSDYEMQRKGHTIEAYGNKGMKNSVWRKSFKSPEHMEKWVEKNDAEVRGTRSIDPYYPSSQKNIGGKE